MAIRAPDGANNPIINIVSSFHIKKRFIPPAGKHLLLAQLAQPSLQVQALPCLLGIMMITVFVGEGITKSQLNSFGSDLWHIGLS